MHVSLTGSASGPPPSPKRLQQRPRPVFIGPRPYSSTERMPSTPSTPLYAALLADDTPSHAEGLMKEPARTRGANATAALQPPLLFLLLEIQL